MPKFGKRTPKGPLGYPGPDYRFDASTFQTVADRLIQDQPKRRWEEDYTGTLNPRHGDLTVQYDPRPTTGEPDVARPSCDCGPGIFKNVCGLCPAGPIPTWLPATNGIEVSLVLPGTHIEVPYDPIQSICADPSPSDLVTASATEGSGGLVNTLICQNEVNQVRVIGHLFTQDADAHLEADGKLVIGWYDWTDNAHAIGVEFSNGTVTGNDKASSASSAQTFRFSITRKTQQLAFTHLAKRPTTFGKTVPTTALLAEPAAVLTTNAVVMDSRNVVCTFSELVSGALLKVQSFVVSPAHPYWDRYVQALVDSGAYK